MSNNKISYLDRNFEDYKQSLREYTARYYPQLFNEFNDASIGSWLIDLVAAVGDNLSYYIDKAYTETNLETATQASSVYNIARTNGFKVPGPKASMAEVEFSCIIPVYDGGDANSSSELGMPDMNYAPVIKRGTMVSSKSQVFEVLDDIDFSKQFNKYGVSDRTKAPIYDANHNATSYKLTKKAIVYAGESKIYKQVINSSDIGPFMEFVIPDKGVMNVESIIFKEGSNYKADPTTGEFMIDAEKYSKKNTQIYRFFEVNSLVDQYRWGDATLKDGTQSVPQSVTYGFIDGTENRPIMAVTKGMWKPITQKFITEFTDKGYLKVIFGSGEPVGQEEAKYEGASDFAQYQISRMVRNNFLGRLPRAGWTMYVLYRVGGGAASNVAAGAINNISYLKANIGKLSYTCSNDKAQKIADVKNSLTVINRNPSVTGKDAPTVEEIKAMIKYNSGAQERCVTVKDYENRIAMLPPRYGCPFRVSAIEENNKIKIFLLGIDHNGKLSAVLPEMLLRNLSDYLDMYRNMNDFVSIEAGEIIHLEFRAKIFVDKNYNSADVAYNVIDTIKKYMDINKHQLGEDIFVGDLEKEISNVDGVLNLIDLEIYNKFKDGSTNINYSASRIAQATEECSEAGVEKLLLTDTNYVLNSNIDSMFEIKNPEEDIKVEMYAR